MKAVKITNKLQDICHEGHSLKNIKLVIKGVEIDVFNIGIYTENDTVKLVVETK